MQWKHDLAIFLKAGAVLLVDDKCVVSGLLLDLLQFDDHYHVCTEMSSIRDVFQPGSQYDCHPLDMYVLNDNEGERIVMNMKYGVFNIDKY